MFPHHGILCCDLVHQNSRGCWESGGQQPQDWQWPRCQLESLPTTCSLHPSGACVECLMNELACSLELESSQQRTYVGTTQESWQRPPSTDPQDPSTHFLLECNRLVVHQSQFEMGVADFSLAIVCIAVALCNNRLCRISISV